MNNTERTGEGQDQTKTISKTKREFENGNSEHSAVMCLRVNFFVFFSQLSVLPEHISLISLFASICSDLLASLNQRSAPAVPLFLFRADQTPALPPLQHHEKLELTKLNVVKVNCLLSANLPACLFKKDQGKILGCQIKLLSLLNAENARQIGAAGAFQIFSISDN